VRFATGSGAVRLHVRKPGGSEPSATRLEARSLRFNRPATARRIADGLAYLEVPAVLGSPGTFETDARAAIRTADAAPTCGWIVDLRRNEGGNLWPMLAAVRPLLGDGSPFAYPTTTEAPYVLKRRDPAVAVLTSRLTSSSGEMLAIAFRGPPTARSFGEATGGQPTTNSTFPLVDGAVIVLTTGRVSDRTGRSYEGPVEPDEAVAIDWTRFGAADDPVVAAAARWLLAQPACAASGR
jgi:C-terminal processing protease CtpA/Prc